MDESRDIPEAILAKIRIEECPVFGLEGDCWTWLGRVTTGGYASGHLEGCPRRLHRYFWEKLRGEIPDKLELDHLCRNKRCVNPEHMEPVTGAVNRDRIKHPVYRMKELSESTAWQAFSAHFEPQGRAS